MDGSYELKVESTAGTTSKISYSQEAKDLAGEHRSCIPLKRRAPRELSARRHNCMPLDHMRLRVNGSYVQFYDMDHLMLYQLGMCVINKQKFPPSWLSQVRKAFDGIVTFDYLLDEYERKISKERRKDWLLLARNYAEDTRRMAKPGGLHDAEVIIDQYHQEEFWFKRYLYMHNLYFRLLQFHETEDRTRRK